MFLVTHSERLEENLAAARVIADTHFEWDKHYLDHVTLVRFRSLVAVENGTPVGGQSQSTHRERAHVQQARA